MIPMTAWLTLATYFLVGFCLTAFRAWRIGVHRAEEHRGERLRGCDHFACELLADDGFMLSLGLLFWPIALPILFCSWFFKMLMRAPYLRSLPPKGSETDRNP